MDTETPIIIYTDGGCSGNPGPGGWACVIVDGDTETKLSGGEAQTTNNRMELTAAIQALAAVSSDARMRARPIAFYSDSQYVKNGITDWIKKWKKNGWLTSSKKPVLNQDLWQRLDALSAPLAINWQWVKGHAGIPYNETCDTLCQKEIANLAAERRVQ
ncbi:MAG: ribonuclease HI [Treponema sp.]|nr:ribonuclease HI [Treponema sp.]